jgi:NADPH-dependent glutamate synthase beta subunit-like oxidoreductase/ferredoxin
MNAKRNRPAAAPETGGAITPSWEPRQVEKTPPCQASCPNCGDIRGWIGLVAQRRLSGMSRADAYFRAWRLITDVNPFPATLGRICPHPCESHCNREVNDKGLAINAMERFLGDHAITNGLPLGRLACEAAEASIGVVGAGPSGLSFAYQMARRGFSVTVYDAREKPGGMLRYGVPDYRLPQDVLDAEIARIEALGVELQMGVRIGRDLTLADLKARHEHLYLAIGAQRGRGLAIPGADGPSVWTSTDYLGRVNVGESVETGPRVVVIGGGNSAIDAARCARRGGADVVILYRRTLHEMPASAEEVEEAVEEGIELMLLAAPLEVERSADGRVTSVRAQHMVLGEPDASGRRRPVPAELPPFDVPADCVIAAISQVPALAGLDQLAHEGDWLVTDAEGAVEPHIWVGGDATGPGIAGEAIYQGRVTAERLVARLTGRPEDEPLEPPQPEVCFRDVKFESKPESEPVHGARLPGEERVSLGMREVASTITEEQFLSEVERCYSCGLCLGCEQCVMYCTSGCFTRADDPAPGAYFTLNTDACRHCGKCIEVCPCGYLEPA